MVGCMYLFLIRWESRFGRGGVVRGEKRLRSYRPPHLPAAIQAVILNEAVRPPKHPTGWRTRPMAKAHGASKASCHRFWTAIGIKPDHSWTFKFSIDNGFEPKLWDVIGLYWNPLCQALALSCNEKSRCQALKHTQQPGLPLEASRALRRSIKPSEPTCPAPDRSPGATSGKPNVAKLTLRSIIFFQFLMNPSGDDDWLFGNLCNSRLWALSRVSEEWEPNASNIS